MAREATRSRLPTARSFDLANFSLRDMAECGAVLRTLGGGSPNFQAAMQHMAEYLYRHFRHPGGTEEQCVLVRGFATCPYEALDEADRVLADRVLGRTPRSPDMKCLSLLGTAGLQPGWNDRMNSRRYRAIPLVSEQFVAQFPMFSQLLKQFGVKIQPVIRSDSDLLMDWEERTHNVFYVPEAVDSPYVPVQQDFVLRYGVRSVLGFGGLLPSHELFAVVLFSKARIPAATADHFRTLALCAKLALLPHDLRADEEPAPCQGLRRTRRDGTESAELAARRLRGQAAVLEQLLAVHERTVIADVIQRDLAEARLDRLRRDYELLLTSAKDGIYGVDRDGNTTFINPAGAAMLRWEPGEVIGRPMHALVHYCKIDGATYPTDACPILQTLQAGAVHSCADEVFWRRDGTCFPVEYSATPIRDGGRIIGAVVMFRDITERREAQGQLQATLERLRTLSQRLQGVREEERTRIARELHDELGVALTCLKIDLSRAHSLLDGGPLPQVREAVIDKLSAMTAQVDQTLTAVQRIVAELRPGVLDDLGLVAAVEWQCRDFQQRTGIQCDCETETDDIAVDPARATAIFRICQEALTNVMRHAEATRVSVRLREQGGRIVLAVRDNGRGIAPEKLVDGRSFGLMGMQERVRALQGSLRIDSQPGAGTTIELDMGAHS